MKKTVIKSRCKKLGAILTVSSLLALNFLSPVAVLAQGSPDIHMEEGDFVHDPEDIVLPELPDLGKLEDLRMPEVERGQFDLSDIEEPNPTNQMEVEVGTFEELQRVIAETVPDTALVINITESFEFNNVIMIREGWDITLQSEGDYTLTQRNGRHFNVQRNSLLTLKDGITLDGASQAGGIGVYNAMFTMEGGHITNNNNANGGGIYAIGGILNMTGGSIHGNSADFGGGILSMNGEVNITGVQIAYNEAVSSGGGMYITGGTVDMTDVEILRNEAGRYGGGMFFAGETMNMTYGLIDGNVADNGGGMLLLHVTTNMTDVVNSNNSARRNGGGMYIDNGTTNLINVQTYNNSADYGGGIFVVEGVVNMIGSTATLHLNRATLCGGGAYILNNGKLTLEGGSIHSNIAEAGGGVYINNGTFVMESGDVVFNSAFQGGGVVVGNLATFTMRAGYILDNSATIDCAVMVYPSGTFNHEGGSVYC
jgi:hypothetical protein